MAGIKRALARALHAAHDKYRWYRHDRRVRPQFEKRLALLGVRASWKDYLRAREQISCNVDEYFAFELFDKTDAQRDTYLTMDRQDAIVDQIGDFNLAVTLPGNKALFNGYFEAFLQREWLNPTDSTPEQFLAFVKRHGAVVVKPTDLYGGKGITLHRYADDAETLRFYDELYGSGAVIEERMIQHEQMNRLNPHCINSVRVMTYTDRDDVHILLATGRSGVDDGIVDNFGSGGVSFAIDWQTGVICADGIDQDLRRIATHPLTGTPFKGFAVPNWDKALDVVRRIARRAYTLPQCRWVGWDLAFLANGEVAVIEGNWRPGTLAQNTHEKGIYHELAALVQKL